MSIIDQAKQHFREQMTEDSLQGPIVVPEWGNAEIYYKKKINFNQMSEIAELVQSGKTFEGVAMGIIIRALDAEGKPIFKKADKTTLMRSVDPEVLLRVAGEMGDVFSMTADEMGNL